MVQKIDLDTWFWKKAKKKANNGDPIFQALIDADNFDWQIRILGSIKENPKNIKQITKELCRGRKSYSNIYRYLFHLSELGYVIFKNEIYKRGKPKMVILTKKGKRLVTEYNKRLSKSNMDDKFKRYLSV